MSTRANMPDADEAPDLTEMDEMDVADPLDGYADELMDDYDDDSFADLFGDEDDSDLEEEE